jgi:hypothetical protein
MVMAVHFCASANMLDLLFYPEHGVSTLLRNVGSEHTRLHSVTLSNTVTYVGIIFLTVIEMECETFGCLGFVSRL